MRPIPVSRRRALFHAPPNQLIRIHTRQHHDAWAVAQKLGYFTGDHGILDYDENSGIDFTYHKPYDWMKNEMSKVIPDFTGERPVWGYLKRPLHKGWYKLRPNMIQFTALVPRKRILFSDYELWHHPLNNWPISETEQDDEAWWETKPRPDPSHTWYKCLDICQEQNYKTNFCGYTDLIQACIDRIYIDEIVKIKNPK
jgi:hypothetical protein